MDSFALIAQVLLAAVFATAGVGKLLDLAGSRRALAGFGVPGSALPVAAVVLPLAELAIAAALLTPESARVGAAAALILLVAFIAGIGRALSRGETPDCHCFGQIHSAPAGRGTLARNSGLALVAAAIALVGPGPTFEDWAAGRSAAELAVLGSSIVIAVLGTISLRLWLDNRGLRRELGDARAEVAALPPGLPIGTTAPSFALSDLYGQILTLESLCARGRPVVLVFATPDCGGCKMLLPDLGRWQATLGDRLTVAVVSTGAPEQNQPAFEEHGISDVILQDDDVSVMTDYRVRATPSAIVVTPHGTVASAPAEGGVTIEPLVRLTLRRASQAPTAGPLQPSNS